MTSRTPLVPLETERPRNARLWPVGTPLAGATTGRLSTPAPPVDQVAASEVKGASRGVARLAARREKLRRILPCRIGDARRLLPLYDAIGDRPERLVRRDLLAIGAREGAGHVWSVP